MEMSANREGLYISVYCSYSSSLDALISVLGLVLKPLFALNAH